MEKVQLGDVEIRPEENSLRVNGQSVHVEPKVMAVLEVLLEHPDRVVSRQLLLQRVWADRVVGEEVLTRCISELRTALGDQAKRPRYVQTVPKKGYRLLVTPGGRPGRMARWRPVAIAAALVLTVAGIAIAWQAGQSDDRGRTAEPMEIDASDLYLLGRHYWNERTPEGLARAVDYFHRAIEADPDLAEAWSGLADAYLLQTSYGDLDSEAAVGLATPLIARALSLNPDLAEGYASRGILLQRLGDDRGAEAALAHATLLDPGNAMAHMWRGNASLALGELRSAFEHYRSAYNLAPQHPAVAHNYVNTLLELGRYDDAREVLGSRPANEHALVPLTAQLALESGDWRGVDRLADALLEDPAGAALLRWRRAMFQRDFPTAAAQLRDAIRQAPGDERAYLAALEFRTLAPGDPSIDDLLMSWQDGPPLSAKVRLMARGWQAIARVREGTPQAAVTELAGLLDELEEDYPPFRMKLLGHLLAALEETGQRAAYDRWRTAALNALGRFVDGGWASFAFEVERGYLLAAAGDRAGAIESFQAADAMGDLSSFAVQDDPRLQDSPDLLKDFI